MNEAINGINTKISNAMHFLGITTTNLSDGDPTATIKINSKDVTLKAEDAGAVVLSAAPSSTGIQYEYVWTGSAWAQLGQEGSFIVVGTKFTNTDIADNAAISQTKIAYSDAQTTGKTLADNITELNKAITDHNEAYNALNGAAWKSDVSNTKYATAQAAANGTSSALTIGNTAIACLVFSCGGAGEN